MAFDTFATKQAALHRAALYLHYARQIHQAGKAMQQLKADYVAGTDTVLVAAVNALFTSGERSALSSMQTPLDTLLSDWETPTATRSASRRGYGRTDD
jgi:hypothetical protein